MSRIRCPICDKFFETDQSQTLPFCSDRCRLIDLSRWLDEKYALPAESADDPKPEVPPEDDS